MVTSNQQIVNAALAIMSSFSPLKHRKRLGPRPGVAWHLRAIGDRIALAALRCFLACFAVTVPALAQSIERPTHDAPVWEVGPYLGLAAHSPITSLGRTPDRNHLFLGIHATATFLSWHRLSLAYAPDAVPLLLVTNTPTYTKTTETRDGRTVQIKQVTGRGVAPGFALSPLGMETQIALTTNLRAFTEVAAGGVWFGRDVPEPNSRAVNYTFEVGGGMQQRIGPRWLLRAGYKFHHLSNAGSGEINPGLNAHVITVGFARRLGRVS